MWRRFTMEVKKAFRGAAFSKGVAFVITVLTAFLLGAGTLAASGQVKDARAAEAVQLTYTKWFSPHFPTMTGVVGGDIVGTFCRRGSSTHPVSKCPVWPARASL